MSPLHKVDRAGGGTELRLKTSRRGKFNRLAFTRFRLIVEQNPRGSSTNERPSTSHHSLLHLVAQIEYADWTDVNHLRHSKFIALRDDKPAKDVRREQAVG